MTTVPCRCGTCENMAVQGRAAGLRQPQSSRTLKGEASARREKRTEKWDKEAVDAWTLVQTQHVSVLKLYPDISVQSLLGKAQTVQHGNTNRRMDASNRRLISTLKG